MSLNSFFDSIDTDAQFDVWKKTITQKLVHLKNTIPIENRDELNYVGETLEFISSLNLLSSDFLAHHPNMDNKKTLTKRLKTCNSFYKKFYNFYFYNFTTPEFNVNVCQLPFWSLTVYYSWKIYKNNKINFIDCLLVGLFAGFGFLSKYLFIYLLISIDLLFIYLIFIKKQRKFDFKYLITFEAFIIILIPHLIWLFNNDYVTIKYGLSRTGIEEASVIDHLKYPIVFVVKQVAILIPFFVLLWTLVKKIKLKLNFKDKKLIFLLAINLIPIFLMIVSSLILGSKIRTMWMTPFYLFWGVLFIYIFQSQINFKKINIFLISFLFLFFLSPALYGYVSLSKDNKRTDYPGKEIAELVERRWGKNFVNEIKYVVGDEWHAGNLSYHISTRPIWYETIKGKTHELDPDGGIIYTGNADILKEICPGDFGKIKKQGFCMIGVKNR